MIALYRAGPIFGLPHASPFAIKVEMPLKPALVRQTYQAVSNILQDRPYVSGDRVSGIDATVYAFLISGEAALFTSAYGDEICARPVLIRYIERIRAEYFPA